MSKWRLCFPVQAQRGIAAFPEAELREFDLSGHDLLWDEPEHTLELIREGTS